jgi:hypothetical protein
MIKDFGDFIFGLSRHDHHFGYKQKFLKQNTGTPSHLVCIVWMRLLLFVVVLFSFLFKILFFNFVISKTFKKKNPLKN